MRQVKQNERSMTKNQGSRRRWIIALIALVAVAVTGAGAWSAFGQDRLEALIAPARSNLAKIEAKAQAGENALKQGVKSVTAAAAELPSVPAPKAPEDSEALPRPPAPSTTVPGDSTTSTSVATLATTGDAQAIARKIKSSAVGVTAVISRTPLEVDESIGTGVVYSADGLIVTNNHVITGQGSHVAHEITVTLSSGTRLSARLVGRDVADDIAVLRVHATGLHPAVFETPASGAKPGEFVVAIGNPRVLAHPVTSGRVISTLDNVDFTGFPGVKKMIETSVPLAHGNSGGPLVDDLGRVIGINAAELVGEKGGLALPASLVVEVTRSLIAH